jgi:transcriptional regulator with XRE-family HTH domain
MDKQCSSAYDRGMKLGIEEELRRAIMNAPMSRYRLAKLSGVSEGVISHFMNRNRDLMLTTATKLAAVLGLQLRPAKSAGKGR